MSQSDHDPGWEVITHPDGRITFTTAHDRLYDPENRRDDHFQFVEGKPRTTPESVDGLVRVWRCGVSEHGECWTTSHMSTREVGLDTKNHTENCGCWRHTILAWAKAQRRKGT